MMAKTLICTQCGHVGKPIYSTKGSILIEFVLWLCFLVPGFIYSIWRLTSKSNVCSQCKSSSLIPIDSPSAKRIFDNTAQKQEDYLEVAKKEKVIDLKKEKTKKIIIVTVAVIFTIFLVIAFSK